MSAIEALSSSALFHRLGATLVEFLWQGTLIAAVYAAARALLSRSSAAARYATGCIALAAMLIAPVVTFWRSASMPVPTLGAAAFARGVAFVSFRGGSGSSAATPASVAAWLTDQAVAAEPWFVLLWVAGVALLSARFLLGWAAIGELRRRWITQPSAAVASLFEELARRLGVFRHVQLLQSAGVRVPTALGVIRPVILLPLSLLTGLSSAEIEAVLAHELAHIRRQDYLVNLLQSIVETLLFYHPAVWWVSASVRAERENCCDDLAVSVTGDARRYARALLRLEETRATAPQLALAASGGALRRRIARLLPRGKAENMTSRSAAALLAAATLVTLGAAARVSSPATSAITRERHSPPALGQVSAASARPPVSTSAPSAPSEQTEPTSARAPVAAAELVQTSQEDQGETTPAPPLADGGREQLLSPDELFALRNHGVTPEFVREIQALGYERASVNALVSLRIHGVGPDFVREINGLLDQRLSLEQCVNLRIHGVTPQYAREMIAAFGRISPEQVQSLRTHGVSSDYLARWREAGYAIESVDEAVTMRNHGVDPSEGLGFAHLGFAKPSIDELLTARNHGVSVEYAREIRESGLEVSNLNVLVALRNHGVSPEFVRSLRALGSPGLSVDDAIVLRNHGVAPDFVRELQSLGYARLSVEDLVALANHGVTAAFARQANAGGRARLSVDELIELRIHARREP